MPRLLHGHGYTIVHRAIGFLVEDVDGPLLPGELARAAEWGARLGGTTDPGASDRRPYRGDADGTSVEPSSSGRTGPGRTS